MRESNSFHATCLDTEPPIFYLNDVSRAAIQAVQSINEKAGRLVAAYTFDAGPNAVIYYEEGEREVVLGGVRGALGGKEGWGGAAEVEAGEGRHGGEAEAEGRRQEAGSGKNVIQEEEDEKHPYITTLRNGITRIIHTSVGDGPVSVQDHLIDEEGNPV